jgi:hypothetical protein
MIVSGVGLFPMNHLAPHASVALWFFRAGLAAVLLFGIAVLAGPRDRARIPRVAGVFSLIAVAAYGSFLAYAAAGGGEGFMPPDPAIFAHRPAFWPLAALEWVVFFATILWFLGVAIVASARRCGSGIPSGATPAPGRQP